MATYLNNTALWQAHCDQVSMVILVIPASHCDQLVPELMNHAKVVVNTFSGKGRLGRIAGLYMELRVCARKFPVNIAHLHSTFAGIVGRLPGIFMRRISVVYQPHGVCYDPQRVGRLSGYVMRCIERFFSMGTDAIVAISDYEGRILRESGVGKRVEVIRNSVVEAGYSRERSKTSRDYFLFVGRMDRQKGFDLLTEFWQKTRRRLVVVGDRVIGQGDHPLNTPNLSFTGWIANEDIDRYYAGAKALIVPSRWEGFGLVVLEAYRNGTPVICSDRGALPELIEEGLTGFVFSLEDIEGSLEWALAKLESMDARQLEENCQRHFKTLCSAEKMNTSLIELYCSLNKGCVYGY